MTRLGDLEVLTEASPGAAAKDRRADILFVLHGLAAGGLGADIGSVSAGTRRVRAQVAVDFAAELVDALDQATPPGGAP